MSQIIVLPNSELDHLRRRVSELEENLTRALHRENDCIRVIKEQRQRIRELGGSPDPHLKPVA